MPSPDLSPDISASRPRPAVVAILVLVCLALIWFSIGDHALHGRSEGRYAVVSLNMASGQGWLIPRYDNHPHLTKPPLTYWLEALCIRALGPTELAVRIPCAVAGSLTLLILLAFAWRAIGPRVAVLAMCLLAIMPQHLVLSRLTLTDPMLTLFWFGTLAGGYLAIAEPREKRWPVLMWVCVALGLLSKGPLAWVPVGIILLWLGVGGRWRDSRALRLVPGMILSALPLLGWVVAILIFDREAAGIWWHEMFTRFTSQADHAKPVYYFIPIFIGGLFPATAILSIPGLNFSWRSAWQSLRRGESACLWTIAVVVPFVMFSCIKGKLPSYLLPLGPPLAILCAMTLDRWFSGANDHPEPGVKPPDVRVSLLVVLAIVAVVMSVIWWAPAHVVERVFKMGQGTDDGLIETLNVRHRLWWVPLVGITMAAAAAYQCWAWNRGLTLRRSGMIVCWLAFVGLWLGLWVIENPVMENIGTPTLLRTINQLTGIEHPMLVTFGYLDTNIPFYTHTDAPVEAVVNDLNRLAEEKPPGLIIVADPRDWANLEKNDPQTAAKFELITKFPQTAIGEQRRIMRVKRDEKNEPQMNADEHR